MYRRSTAILEQFFCMCARVDTGSVEIKFPPFCQGSSVVEQGTHKPLVGSSNLPPGTPLLLRFCEVWLEIFVAAADCGHEANAAVFSHRTCPTLLMNIAPAGKAQH